MKRVFIYILSAVLLLSTIISGCSSNSKPQIIIGAILPLSGDYEYFGLVAREIFELGMQEADDNIKSIYEDSAGQSDIATAALDKLVKEDKATVIITLASWISNSVYPLAVSFTAPLADEVEHLGQYLQGFSRIGIIYQNNDFGKEWEAELKDTLTGKVVASESYDIALEEPFISTEQIRQDLLNIQAELPDVLVCLSIGKQAVAIANEASGIGLDLPLVGPRPIATPDLFAGGEIVEGRVFTYPSYDASHPIVQQYETAYDKQFTVNGAEAYDCLMTLIKATQESGKAPADIYNWYLNREYYGALGHITFDNKARAHYSFALQEVHDGGFVPYQQD